MQGAAATLLLTLAARAAAGDADTAAVGFSDPEACRIARAMSFDVSVYAQDRAFVRSVVLRAALFDRYAADFFAAHPRGVGVTLGAGLCTRRSRLGPRLQGVGIDWLNVDLPEVIQVREQYLAAGEAERNFACSILEPAWMDAVDPSGTRPVLLMLEGVCPYLPQAALQAMLNRIAARFARAARACMLVMDYVHPVLTHRPMQVGSMRLPVISGFDDSAQIAGMHPWIRLLSEDHPYARFSAQHRLFETGLQAATGRRPYTIARFALEPEHDA